MLILAHRQKVFDIVKPQSRNRGLVNNIVKTSFCQRNAFGNIALTHDGTFGTMQIGALPNGVTDQLHQIGIALSGLSGSRQKIVLYGQTSRDKAVAHRERYLHLVDRRQIFGEGTTQERKRLAVNKIHNAGQ